MEHIEEPSSGSSPGKATTTTTARTVNSPFYAPPLPVSCSCFPPRIQNKMCQTSFTFCFLFWWRSSKSRKSYQTRRWLVDRASSRLALCAFCFAFAFLLYILRSSFLFVFRNSLFCSLCSSIFYWQMAKIFARPYVLSNPRRTAAHPALHVAPLSLVHPASYTPRSSAMCGLETAPLRKVRTFCNFSCSFPVPNCSLVCFPHIS